MLAGYRERWADLRRPRRRSTLKRRVWKTTEHTCSNHPALLRAGSQHSRPHRVDAEPRRRGIRSGARPSAGGSDQLCDLSAVELAASRLRRRGLSARDVMAAHLTRIERINPKVNAIVTLVAERAMANAARADELAAVACVSVTGFRPAFTSTFIFQDMAGAKPVSFLRSARQKEGHQRGL